MPPALPPGTSIGDFIYLGSISWCALITQDCILRCSSSRWALPLYRLASFFFRAQTRFLAASDVDDPGESVRVDGGFTIEPLLTCEGGAALKLSFPKMTTVSLILKPRSPCVIEVCDIDQIEIFID
jgi:hypothetical protein